MGRGLTLVDEAGVGHARRDARVDGDLQLLPRAADLQRGLCDVVVTVDRRVGVATLHGGHPCRLREELLTQDIRVAVGRKAGDQVVSEVTRVGGCTGVPELQKYVGGGQEPEKSQTMKFECGWRGVILHPVWERCLGYLQFLEFSSRTHRRQGGLYSERSCARHPLP